MWSIGVSYVTLRRWIKEGKIRAVQTLGGKYRIPESEVKRLLSGI
ncbi:MAG: IS607 family transposase, partial [Thermoprotei archaeon]